MIGLLAEHIRVRFRQCFHLPTLDVSPFPQVPGGFPGQAVEWALDLLLHAARLLADLTSSVLLTSSLSASGCFLTVLAAPEMAVCLPLLCVLLSDYHSVLCYPTQCLLPISISRDQRLSCDFLKVCTMHTTRLTGFLINRESNQPNQFKHCLQPVIGLENALMSEGCTFFKLFYKTN